jgi:hypothetical protein
VMADANFKATERYFDRIVSGNRERRGGPNIAALNQFFVQMPKGGDIHHHYSGAIYAETYLGKFPFLDFDFTTQDMSITVFDFLPHPTILLLVT